MEADWLLVMGDERLVMIDGDWWWVIDDEEWVMSDEWLMVMCVECWDVIDYWWIIDGTGL